MRNILVFVCDTLRRDAFDRYFGFLREGSIFYDQGWATAGSTIPSWFSIWTGLEPVDHGAVKPGLWPDAPGLDVLGQELGYNVLCVTENGYARAAGHFIPFSRAPRGAGFEYIKTHLPSEPWLVYYHNMGPHSPYLGMPESSSILANQDAAPPDRHTLQRLVDAYDISVGDTARRLHEFLDWLPEHTLVFVSDHGEAFGEHGFLGHVSDRLFTELMHVPLLVRDGGTTEVCYQPTSICATPGLIRSAAEDLRIRWLPSVVRGQSFFYEFAVWQARCRNWVAFWGEAIATMFYDLDSDPGMHDELVLTRGFVPPLALAQLDPEITRRYPPPVSRNIDDEQQIEDHLRELGYIA